MSKAYLSGETVAIAIGAIGLLGLALLTAERHTKEIGVRIAAGALAILIALITVVGHAFLVARAKPVEALRYE